jgi:hypothetical protein
LAEVTGGVAQLLVVRHHYVFMTNQAFVYTYKTKAGTFRIQPHKDKFALFIDYPQGDWDLKTVCVSVEDGVDYVSHQDTGVREWDDLDSIPDNVRRIEAWQRRPFHPQSS